MSLVRNLIKRWLLKRNIVLSRPPGQFSVDEIKMRQIRDRGLRINMAIDGGAAEGAWARELKSVYPEAQILCIEPREDAQAELQRVAAELGGVRIAKTLIGANIGTVEFHEHGEQSSVLAGSSGGAFGRLARAQMTTLDALVAAMQLPPPDLIKLDLQGFELEALAGAGECLRAAQAVQVEISFMPFQANSPLMADVVGFMKERGFRMYDVLGLWHRPLDGALAQGDFMFLREGHPLLADTRWGTGSGWT